MVVCRGRKCGYSGECLVVLDTGYPRVFRINFVFVE